MTKVTIIIHEGRGRRLSGRPHSGRDGAEDQFSGRGRHSHRAPAAQPGSEWQHPRHGHHTAGDAPRGECACGHHGHHTRGERPGDERRFGHRSVDAQPGSERAHGRHSHHGHHVAGDAPGGEHACGHRGRHRHGERGQMGERPFAGHHHRPDAELSEAELAQRQLARQVRRDVRRVLREAEAAGLSPERAARVVRRETRRSFL